MTYVDYVYEIVKKKCENSGSIYEDHIELLVGTMGLLELIKNGYLESCGSINGRRLYVLTEKKGE